MGRSKQELFLERVVAAATPVFNRVVAVQRAGQPPLAIETIFEGTHEAGGPVFGVLRALEDAQAARSLILATDYPLITSELLRFLAGRFEESSAAMLVPLWDGEPQVLCAGYSPSLEPILRRRVAAGTIDLRGLLGEAEVETISEEELRQRFGGEPLMNVNTPEELARAERLS